MYDKRSISALQSGRQAAQRFDYFMAGLISAILAYLLPNYTLDTELIVCGVFDGIALVLLIFAFGYALRRIESTVECSRLNHSVLLNGEMAATIATAILNKEATGVSSEGGEIILPGDFQKKWNHYRDRRQTAYSELTKESIVAEWRGRLRDHLLISGFVLILFSKGIVGLYNLKIIEFPDFLKSRSIPPRAIPIVE